MAKGITWPGYEGEPRHFTGIPGVYGPGVVLPLESIGISEEGARERIAGTPLEIVDLAAPKHEAPESPAADGGE